ncbi:MAG: electron transport complex protein RnfA [Cyclobacteriaceae bacterium]|jgi:electron transport complex protein RnfA
MDYVIILISTVFINNIVLAKFLGICPFLGVSKSSSTALGMGVAVVFVMTISTIFTWLVYTFLLLPLDLGYLQTVTYILVIAFLVQVVEIVMKKVSPDLYQALGVYLPLITTNCTILGVALLVIQNEFSLLKSVVFAVGNSVGFTLAIVIFSSLREQLDMTENLPPYMKGTPAALLIAGILAMAFMGFAGLV